MTLGLLELYTKVKDRFRPTPSHAHYVFSLHDISRVVQGILLMSPRSRTRKMMKIRKESELECFLVCHIVIVRFIFHRSYTKIYFPLEILTFNLLFLNLFWCCQNHNYK